MRQTKRIFAWCVGCVAGAVVVSASHASVISGRFVDDARCDTIANQTLTREIGDASLFAAVDALVYHDHRYHLTVGVPDDGIANDWTVHIENVSGQAWKDLFFVADSGASIGNADGKIEDQLGAPGTFCDAFRVDAAGTNVNLLHESMNADGILEIGEEWEFAVSNFVTGTSGNYYAPSLVTPGAFAGSSLVGGPGQTNASIVATPVPEPTMIGALLVPTLAMLLRHPRRRNAR